MSEFVNTVDIVGDETLTNNIIDRSITEIADNITTSIGNYAFRGCSALTAVNFQVVTKIGIQSFNNCSALTAVDLPAVTTIGNEAFRYCNQLKTLILRSTTMVLINAASILTSTPIASGTGYIYVPRALVDSYKAASKWSTYASQIRALEDYTVDGTITGALDESKI